jgi:hypothetical protein
MTDNAKRRWRVIVYTNQATRLVKLPVGLRWEPEPEGFGQAVACRCGSRDVAKEVVTLCQEAGLHGIAKLIPEPATKIIVLPLALPASARRPSYRYKGPKREKQTLHGRNTGPARTLSAHTKRVAKRNAATR